MQEFQAANIDAIRSDRVVCIVSMSGFRVKAFQIFFGKDGSLFVTFPYFRHRIGILSSSAIPATGTSTAQVNLEDGGKVTSHLVKYSHHTDGHAHFSQDGKIITEIKRQSIALDTQHGHLFSLTIQGLNALDTVHPTKDVNKGTQKTVIDFPVEPSDAIKFVGRWLDVNRMRFTEPTPTIGPTLPMFDTNGRNQLGCMVASPYANARHVLLLTCEGIPSLGPAPEHFLFYGGFDPPELMTDPNKEAGFLAFLYPIEEPEQIKERIGTVDYVPKEKAVSYDLHAAAKHVVHDYAYLVAAGEDTQKSLPFPQNHYAERTFLVHCRALAKFFSDGSDKRDLYAKDFVHTPHTVTLTTWDSWHEHIDKQLAHLTVARITNTRQWTGKDNKNILDEFRSTWRDFYSKLTPSVKPTFDAEIAEMRTAFPDTSLT